MSTDLPISDDRISLVKDWTAIAASQETLITDSHRVVSKWLDRTNITPFSVTLFPESFSHSPAIQRLPSGMLNQLATAHDSIYSYANSTDTVNSDHLHLPTETTASTASPSSFHLEAGFGWLGSTMPDSQKLTFQELDAGTLFSTCGCVGCMVSQANLIVPAEDATSPTDGVLSSLSFLPALSSNSASPFKIYLDFNGHTTSGTPWNTAYNGGNSFFTPAYSIDSDTNSFSSVELANIQQIWKRVSEDFAPFNVDVTTIEPTTLAGPNNTRVVIGGSYTSWLKASAGGVAYLNSWQWNDDTPCYVFSADFYTVKGVAEAASHEAGHTLGLRHQSLWVNGTKTQEYNPGLGSGATGWAPIMGNSYSKELTTWHNGTNSQGVNQDDMAVIAKISNGFGYRLDDHGNTNATATALTGTSLGASGIISTTSDIDVFSFFTGAGLLNLAVNVAEFGANLDVLAELWNSSGSLVSSNDALGFLTAGFINTPVSAGQYFLHIKSNGAYGRVGQYTVSGNVQPIVSISNVTVTEGNSGTTNAVFAVNLSAPSTQVISVNFTTELNQGTAQSGVDYTPTIGTLIFNPGETSKTIVVPVLGDTIIEANESFYVDLLNPTNANLTTSWAAGRILNDDLPTISVNDVSLTEGNSGKTDAVFTVSLSAAISTEVSVKFTTEFYPASATPSVDYTPTIGTLTFAPGETSKTVLVPVIGDTVIEPDEIFYLDLMEAVNATIADFWGIGRILNDDIANVAPNQLQFSTSKATYTVGETLGLSNAWVYDGNGTSDLARVNFWVQRPDGVWDDVADALSFTPGVDPNWAKFDSYGLSLTGYTPGTYTLWGVARDQAGATSNAFQTYFTIAAGTTGTNNLAPNQLQFSTSKAIYTVGETLGLSNAWVYDGNGTSDLARVNFWVQRPDGVWDDVADALSFTPGVDPNWTKFDGYGLSLTGYTPGTYTLWGMAHDQAGATSNAFQTYFTIAAGATNANNLAPNQLQFSTSKATYTVGETLGLSNAWVYDGNGTSDLARVNFWVQRPDGVWDDVADALSFTPAPLDANWAKFDSYGLNLTGYAPGSYTLWGVAKDLAGASSNEFQITFAIV